METSHDDGSREGRRKEEGARSPSLPLSLSLLHDDVTGRPKVGSPDRTGPGWKEGEEEEKRGRKAWLLSELSFHFSISTSPSLRSGQNTVGGKEKKGGAGKNLEVPNELVKKGGGGRL